LHPEVSPDGTCLAIEIREVGNTDVWVYDLTRETLTRLTFDPAVDERPLWTPDGQRVVFTSHRDGAGNLFWKAADGTGEVERLTTSQNLQTPHSWSSDGTQLVVNDDFAISVLSLQGERQVAPLLEAAPRVAYPTISPDGQWMAYKAVESGPDEIYVRPFPDVNGGRWQISTDEGDDPVWAPDGRELFYRGSGGRMMAVPMEAEPTFNPGIPEALFEGRYLEDGGVQYDVPRASGYAGWGLADLRQRHGQYQVRAARPDQ
jgi:serine/threonine-protein kinase